MQHTERLRYVFIFVFISLVGLHTGNVYTWIERFSNPSLHVVSQTHQPSRLDVVNNQRIQRCGTVETFWLCAVQNNDMNGF